MIQIDFPKAYKTEVFGINDSGDIVGSCELINSGPCAFIKKGDDFIPLDLDSNVFSSPVAYNINSSGQIVGSYKDYSQKKHGFFLESYNNTSDVITIDFPGASETEVFGINDSGDIVGKYKVYTDSYPAPDPYSYPAPDSGFFAFIKKGNDFIPLDLESNNLRLSVAYGVNKLGCIVGSYLDHCSNVKHGFLIPPPSQSPLCQDRCPVS